MPDKALPEAYVETATTVSARNRFARVDPPEKSDRRRRRLGGAMNPWFARHRAGAMRRADEWPPRWGCGVLG